MSSGQEVGAIFGQGNGPATALLRSPTVIIASVALWGMNVCLFRLFGIDYVHVLTLDLKKGEEENSKNKKRGKKDANGDILTHLEAKSSGDGSKNSDIELTSLSMLGDEGVSNNEMSPIILDDGLSTTSSIRNSPDYEITEAKLLGLAALLIFTLYSTSYIWIQIGRGTTIGAIFCFYFFVVIGVLVPLPSTAWLRLACRTVFRRAGELLRPRCSCIHGKPKPVPFIDVFFADAMCSMSKVSRLILDVYQCIDEFSGGHRSMSVPRKI